MTSSIPAAGPARRALLVYGAGAIGRGYMPWVYAPDQHDFHFVEADAGLREALRQRGRYTSWRTTPQGYERREVAVASCVAPGQEQALLERVDGIVTCVGPRNFDSLEPALAAARVPVVCCENDARLPERMRARTGNEHIVFAIPDVITSCTARDDLLAEDPLAIVTEDGQFFADDHARTLGGQARYLGPQALAEQWAAKLYIHNTPHCIAAYLGSLLGVRYLHEAMAHAGAAAIVEGAMREMQRMIVEAMGIDAGFAAWYADKELARFRNPLLCDPIRRVAREPFRKLALDERLIGAAQRCLAAGIAPRHLGLGILAAFRFDQPQDPDLHIRHLLRSLEPAQFLRTIIRLRPGEALFELLLRDWSSHMHTLESLRDDPA